MVVQHTVVRPWLPPFLGRSRPVEVATRLLRSGEIATERYELGPLDSYGSTVEAPTGEPTSGTPIRVDVFDLGDRATRLRFHRGAPVTESLVLRRPGTVVDDPARVAHRLDVTADPFALVACRGRLRMRPHDLESLRRIESDAWPAHEHRWQVLHRFGYPLGCTSGDGGEPSAWFATFELGHDERIHGLGEDFGPLAKNGTSHDLWMQEAFSNGSPAVYKPIPFWWSTAGYGVVVNTTNPVRVDVGARDHTAISVVVDGVDALDLVVIDGDTPADIIGTYCELTGTPRVPPEWSFGIWMSRISYRDQREVEEIAAELVHRDIPVDVMHLDTHWFADDWNCDYEFCPGRFPEPEAMIERLRSWGIRLSLWQWPNVLVDSAIYRECVERGILAFDAGCDQPLVQQGFIGPAALLDYSHPEAAVWIREKLRPLLEMGVAAIKTDFGEGAPIDATYHGIDAMAMHNAYPLLYNRAVMAVSEEVHGDDAVVWSRSGWAGSQRYPIHWSGDGVARWDDLACVVRSMLSIGLSGVPFYGHDIGGFSGVPDADLYVRWTQLGVVSSHLRFHGFPPREPWAFGDEVEQVVRELLHLRKRLQPYLFRTAQAATLGLPVCRAMVLAVPEDPTCAFLDDQYLVGDDLLAAPMMRPSGGRRIYVPAGDWIDWWSGAVIDPGWHDVDAPLDRFPLFARAGSSVSELAGDAG